MSDVKNAYDQINEFIINDTEKTLLLRGIADKEKNLNLLKALNSHGKLKGLVYLIHTTKDGIENFFRTAELYNVKIPNKYGQGIKLSHLSIFFDNLTTKSSNKKYDNYTFDFMIIWPIQSVTKNQEEILILNDMAKRQKTKKIIYLTCNEPSINPDSLVSFADRVIKLDCENDNPQEYKRIMDNYKFNINRCNH